jgi:L-threonylcarbamoyladenylate synthase
MNDWQVAVYPTDTVWGLVGKFNEENYHKIYDFKQRDRDKPLILFTNNIETIKKYSIIDSKLLEKVCEKYWPGALTVICLKNNRLPEWLNPEFKTIAWRIPDVPDLLKILDQLDEPLLSTSANLQSEAPIENSTEAREKFQNKVDYIYDGDYQVSGEASTIVSLVNDEYTVLRQGEVEFELES